MASECTLPPHLSHWGLLGTCTGAGVADSWNVVALESVSAEILVRGFVAQVSAKLVYCNNSSKSLQVKTVFPVDESAAVYHCEAKVDGRTIVTHCMEKSKAEKVYNEAVAQGKTAVMAREHDDTSDILTLNLGNLLAGARAELNLHLVMELKVQTDGAVSFVLPTVLNPRYSPADQTLPKESCTEELFERHSEACIMHVPQLYSIDVKAQVCGSHRIARIISHTDSLNVTLSDDAMSAQVGQDGGFKCDHDWSMLVYYNNAYQPHLLRETGDRSATGIMKDDLLMLNFFPEVPTNTYSSRNEIIFVVDRSGSMQGENIQSAKATLLLFLKSLPMGCLFNVVSFGSTFSLLFPKGSRLYTEETLKEACHLHSKMEADMGGTEILRPLQKVYSKAPTPGFSRQILLITDGGVWNVDQVLQLVGRHAHETRLFSVGVGYGASTALVRGAARAGRGRCEMVVQQSLLQQKVMGLVSSMVQENVQDVSIACEVEPASSVRLVPKVPPVIFGGQHLILYARVPSNTQVKKVTVRGQLGNNTILNVLEGQHLTVIHDEAKSIHRLAARAQIQQWQLDEEEDIAKDMVALSVASGVVSCHTALVGVDQESGKPVPEYCGEPIPEYCDEPYSGRSYQVRSLKKKGTKGLITRCADFLSQNLQQPLEKSSPRKLNLHHTSRVQRRKCCAPVENCLYVPATTRVHNLAADEDCVDGTLPVAQSCESNVMQHILSGSQVMQEAGSSMLCSLLEVVNLQQFDGSWKLKDAAQLTNVPLDVLSASNPAKGEAAWATALVLVLLERKFDDQRDQWTLLATKARTFIAGCGEQVEELLAKACLSLDSKEIYSSNSSSSIAGGIQIPLQA